MIKSMLPILAILISSLLTIDAQNVPSCASKLVPCFGYMNVTNPPETCCKPLKETIETQLDCLCNLYSTPGLLPSFGVNVTEALALPARCGISGDLSACGKAQSPGSSTTPAGTDKNGGDRRIAAFANLFGVVLFITAAMLS